MSQTLTYYPIQPGGYIQHHCEIHPQFDIDETDFHSNGIVILNFIAPDEFERIPISSSNLTFDTTEQTNSGSNSSYTASLQYKHQKLIWSGVNQMFFGGDIGIDDMLHRSGSIISIPMSKVWDGIKKGTVALSGNNSGSVSFSVTDDSTAISEKRAYLTDGTISITNVPSGDNLIGYWGFNDSNLTYNSSYTAERNLKDESFSRLHITAKGFKLAPGINSSGVDIGTHGDSIELTDTTNGYIYVPYEPNFNYNIKKDKDYSFSLWTNLPPSQSTANDGTNTILTKGSFGRRLNRNLTQGLTQYLNYNVTASAYPFELSVYNSTDATNNGKLRLRTSDGVRTLTITSSTQVNDGWHHISVVNRNSSMELWVDGTMESSQSYAGYGSVTNDNHIMLLKRSTDNSAYSVSGSLDELRFYKTSLSTNEISTLANRHYLSGSLFATNKVGEVRYKQGFLIINTPHAKYKNLLSGNPASGSNPSFVFGNDYTFDLSWQGTKVIKYSSVFCELKANTLNASMNPTIRLYDDPMSDQVKGFVSGSTFMPYITTFGLYNENYELIATAKLATPVQRRKDIDMTFNIRWDMPDV